MSKFNFLNIALQIEAEKPLADEEAEKAAALETGAFFDTEDNAQESVPKKKAAK